MNMHHQNRINSIVFSPPPPPLNSPSCCQVHGIRGGRCRFGKIIIILHAIIETSGGRGGWWTGRRWRTSEGEAGGGRLWKAVMRDCDPGWQLVRSVSHISFLSARWSFRRRSPCRSHQKITSLSLSLTLCHMMASPSMATPRCPAPRPCDWNDSLISLLNPDQGCRMCTDCPLRKCVTCDVGLYKINKM